MWDPFHNWSYNLALNFFDHDHRWLHIILHIVLVVTPLLLTAIMLCSVYRIIRSYYIPVTVHPVTALRPATTTGIPLQLRYFIKKYTFTNQCFLAAGALLTLPITYANLELPKRIINGAINKENFVTSKISISLSQIDYLLLLCGLFLLVLLANGILKFVLNYYKGSVAETLIRRLRLYILRQRRQGSANIRSTDMTPVIIQEVEPVCSFSGDSIAIPLLQGGTALTIITFMLVQNLTLGAAAITLLPIQMIIIPRFQCRINRLVQQRLLSVRKLSQLLSEASDKKSYAERKQIRGFFGHLHGLRLQIFKTKYLMKAINNFIMNLTPFFFYTIGGYLVIEGKLSLGALVASLASYKDLASAIRELFNYYQSLQDARIRYREIVRFIQQQ